MIKMTYGMAHAIATDDADRHMRKHGRKHWNKEDYRVAAKKIEDLTTHKPSQYFTNGLGI